jgi:hypothetical protein
MVAIKKPELDATLEAAFAAFASKRNAEEDKPRQYLGCSVLGHDCSRKLWLTFRATKSEAIEAKGWAAIDDGHRGEDIIVERINAVEGVTLHPANADGSQFAVTACGGHVRGHMDGAVIGLLQAPKTWHVFEAKVCNETKFKKLKQLRDKNEKEALESWDNIYYVQAQLYMGLTGMTRHWLVCATPGVRDWTSVRTEFNQANFNAIIEHAEHIIAANEPPPKISNDPSFYQCKWCDFSKYCHGNKVPPPNCRNCAHSTPTSDGKWKCEKFDKEAADPCEHHVFIPQLIPYAEQIDMWDNIYNEKENWIEYKLTDGRTFKNGTRPPGSAIYTSEELQHTEPAMFQDSTVDALRCGFGAEMTENDAARLPRVNTDKPPMDWDGGGDSIPF